MNILIVGSGGREHALVQAAKRSPMVNNIFCTPGNAGIAKDATCLPLPSQQAIVNFCGKESIGLVIVGPEQPLVEGLADVLNAVGIPVFGPSAAAAQLEASKGFSKDLCKKYRIPTAAYQRFEDHEKARAYVERMGAPIVVKADGLAAGKGVVVAMSVDEALEAVDAAFAGRFGAAGKSLVIEEFLEGEEASFFALCDGDTAIEFACAQDHKRAYDGDEGPNTGGMGAYSPPPVMTEALRAEVMERIVLPTVQAMKDEGAPYRGILFVGLMITKRGPQVIEYNVRFGDPETQAMLPRLSSDIIPAFLACANGSLDNIKLSFYPKAAMCVVMAAEGYPGDYKKGTVIDGLDEAAATLDVTIFHAGTAKRDGKIIAAGGRVLGVTALGDTIEQAQKHAYEAIDKIKWPEGFCRRDIGWRAIKSSAA